MCGDGTMNIVKVAKFLSDLLKGENLIRYTCFRDASGHSPDDACGGALNGGGGAFLIKVLVSYFSIVAHTGEDEGCDFGTVFLSDALEKDVSGNDVEALCGDGKGIILGQGAVLENLIAGENDLTDKVHEFVQLLHLDSNDTVCDGRSC